MGSIRGKGFTTNQLKSRYRKKVEVFLEGADDLGVYKNYWFAGLVDKIHFRLAEDGDLALPGCNGVERNVISQRSAGIDAYGLIDRDAVNDIHLACDPDDVAFVSTNSGRNPHVYYTIRWELENYLVDASAWEHERVNAKTRGEGRRSDDEVVAELLEHCKILVAHAAANVVRHLRGQPKIGDGFGTGAKCRADFENLLFTGPMRNASQADRAEYNQWVEKIEAFDIPSSPPIIRLLAMCRRVHGKALIERFFRTYNIQDDKRFSVAGRLAANVPNELAARVQSWID
jgi:hypothetical protein